MTTGQALPDGVREVACEAAYQKHYRGYAPNPFLPLRPEDGQHKWNEGPSDIGGNRRCKLCGAYRRSPESEQECRGEYHESGKMRMAAQDWWERSWAEAAAEVAYAAGREDAAQAVEAYRVHHLPDTMIYVAYDLAARAARGETS